LHDGAAPRLAPFYDLLSMCVYPGLSRKLALSVAGRSDPGQIGHADWIRLGELLDVRPTYVIELAAEMTEALPVVVEESVAAFRETHGHVPVLQMVPPVLLRQTRRTRRLLSAKKS
jgi:serine/threonine-protein kinase HipA